MNLTSASPVFRPLQYRYDRTEQPRSVRASLTSKNAVFILSTSAEQFSIMVDDNSNIIESGGVAANSGDISLYKLPCDNSVIAVSSKLEPKVNSNFF